VYVCAYFEVIVLSNLIIVILIMNEAKLYSFEPWSRNLRVFLLV